MRFLGAKYPGMEGSRTEPLEGNGLGCNTGRDESFATIKNLLFASEDPPNKM